MSAQDEDKLRPRMSTSCRPWTCAVVHCHSRHATILACAGREIPAMHYMVAVGGGSSIPLAPYAISGSMELAQAVVETLDGRSAALMANHGQIVVARNLNAALAIAEEVEEQAAVYWGTLAIGGPHLLDQAEMARILGRFRSYGQNPSQSAFESPPSIARGRPGPACNWAAGCSDGAMPAALTGSRKPDAQA